MKNKKLTKIFVAILSLALLVGAAVGITAAADEADTYAIKSINVAHGDTTQILVAVDAPVADAENIEVKYTFNGETLVANYYKNIDIYENGTEYPVFYTKGIGAKDCGQSVVAEAHKKGTTPAEPEYKEISVAEYLFTKLYVEGYISATEGEALERKNLYVEFIEYISSAEEVLYNYKNPDTPRQLLNTKSYVYAENAYVAQVGGNSGFFNSDFLALNYTGTEKGQIGWYVSTETKNELVFGNIIALAESAKIAPYFDNNVIDFEDSEINAGVAIDWVTDNLAGQVTHTVGGAISGGIVPNYMANADIVNGRITTGGTHVLVKDDATGNKFLSFKVVPRTYYTTTETSLGDRSDAPGFFIPVTDVDANANASIWSFDATFDSSCSSLFAQIMYLDANGKNIIYPSMNASNGKTVYFNDTTGAYAEANRIASVPTSSKVNVRYEYYWAENVLQIYIDNVFVGSTAVGYSGGSAAKPAKISFSGGSSSACGVAFDNMRAINICKPYVEEPISAPAFAAAYETFSNGYYTETSEWKCTNATYAKEITNGVFTHKDADGNPISTEGYTVDTVFTANNKYFATGISSKYGVDAKVHNPTNDIVTDANGNDYLALVSPARISDRDRAYSLLATPTVLNTEHKTYVFDMDFRPVKGAFSFIIYTTANKHVQFSVGTVDNVFAIGGAQICNYGEWATVRFVIDTANATISLYKLVDGEYTLLSDNLTTIGGDIANMNTTLRDVSMQPSSNSEVHYDNVALYTAD